MGNRFFNERIPEGKRFCDLWGKPGNGRYWKRKLSKARRKAAKQRLQGNRARDPVALESTVNYKTW